jgi:hypothetical protein
VLAFLKAALRLAALLGDVDFVGLVLFGETEDEAFALTSSR